MKLLRPTQYSVHTMAAGKHKSRAPDQILHQTEQFLSFAGELNSRMFQQEKEFFSFHFRRILVLFFAALLYPSEAQQKATVAAEIKSCSHAASAWMKKNN